VSVYLLYCGRYFFPKTPERERERERESAAAGNTFL